MTQGLYFVGICPGGPIPIAECHFVLINALTLIGLPAKLEIQFALYFSHLQDLYLGLVFSNLDLIATGGNISFRTVIATLRSLYSDPAFLSQSSPAHFKAANHSHYFHQNVL